MSDIKMKIGFGLLVGLYLTGLSACLNENETDFETSKPVILTARVEAGTPVVADSVKLDQSTRICACEQVAKQISTVSCDNFRARTVYWKAMNQDVHLTTQIAIDGDTKARTTNLRLELTDGTTLNLGNASFEEDKATHPDCMESLIVSTDSTLESLSGQREFSKEDIYFSNYSDLYNYNATALECHQPSVPTYSPVIPYENQTHFCKAAIDHWNAFSKYGQLTNRHLRWTNQRNQRFVSLKAPIIYVTRSKNCTDILVYDPIEKIMRFVMSTNLKCIELSEE